MRSNQVCCLLLASVFGALVVSATNRYVVAVGTIANGLDVPPYNTWTNASTNIQWAVDVATNTETVWVSNGVYVLTNQILITNAIILRGTNGPEGTIINGNYTPGSATTNNRCLLLSNAAAFVSGVTLSNGAWAEDATSPGGGLGGGGARIFSGTMSNCVVRDNYYFRTSVLWYGSSEGGGGVYMSGGTVTVSRIHANIATNGWRNQGGGAGIYFTGAGSLVYNCVISNNTLSGTSADTPGGGAYGCGVIMTAGARLESSMICYNIYLPDSALGSGGGVYMSASTMSGCTSTLNRVGYQSGVSASGGTITNCVISYNRSQQYGSGMGLSAAAGSYVRVYNTLIMGNTNGGNHAVVYVGSGPEVTMNNCRIINNRPNSYTTISVLSSTNFSLLNSEVISNGLGIFFNTASSGKLRNCLIADSSNNTGDATYRGGGVTIYGGTTNVSISGCTIIGNMDNTRGTGAGLRFAGTNIGTVVSSCIIYSNGIGGTDDVFDVSSPTHYNALQYSCVGTNNVFTGAGIIVTNPLLKDYAGGNYRLLSGSPCINAGSNETWMTNSTDLAGYTRLRFGRVDMGAYEWHPAIKVNGIPYEKIRFINGVEPRWINGVP